MKRNTGILVGLATLGVMLGTGAFGIAQQQYGQNQQPNYPAAQPAYGQQPQYNPPAQYSQSSTSAPLQTRGIRVINIGQVIKKYQKFQQYEASLKQVTQELQKKVEGQRAQAQNLQKEMERPDTPSTRREELERQMKQLQRQAQDELDEAKQRMTKNEFEQMVQIYKEVEDAVGAYCRSGNIELVLQYSDAMAPDKYLPQNFQQKLVNRACMPIYVDPRMDISQAVVDMLNRRLASAPGAPAIHGN